MILTLKTNKKKKKNPKSFLFILLIYTNFLGNQTNKSNSALETYTIKPRVI